MQNGPVILFISALTGLAVNISSISAQAYLLAAVHPKYYLYTTVAVSILFSIYQAKFGLKKLKFVHFSMMMMGGICGSLFFASLLGFHLGFLETVGFAFVWVILALLAADYFRWSLNELTIRHMDPGTGSAHLSYVMMSFEGGSLIAALLIFSGVFELNSFAPIMVSCVLQGVIIAIYGLQFGSAANLEVAFTRKTEKPPEFLPRGFQHVLTPLLCLGFFCGLFRSTEDYILRLASKNYLQTYLEIQRVFAQVYTFRGLLIILFSSVLGWLIERKRPSMIRLVNIYLFSSIGISIYCFFNPTLGPLIGLSSITRAFERSFYAPSIYLLSGALIPPFRGKLRSLHHFAYATFAGILIAFFVGVVGPLIEDPLEIKLMLGLFGGFGLAAWVANRFLHSAFLSTLQSLAASDHKTSAILAVHTLSFLKPGNFSARMIELLKKDPKKVLRKAIIEGLAYSPTPDATDIILKEFQSDKETIQIAVLEALKITGNYSGIQFIFNIATAKQKSNTPLVRMSAVRLLSQFYGKKAIPLLLNGLEDTDSRILANSLEQLALFREYSLIPYFRRFSKSEVPRIRSTALLGLESFSETKAEYREGLQALLKSGDPASISSALYTVGAARDTQFSPELETLLHSPLGSDPSIRCSLAWALSSFRDRRGYHLFSSCFKGKDDPKETHRALHFIALLPRDIRFDLFRNICNPKSEIQADVTSLLSALKTANQDFHEEINYIQQITLEVRGILNRW